MLVEQLLDPLLQRRQRVRQHPAGVAREQLLREASQIALDDVGIIPIHIQKNIWAMRPGLVHEARADELTRAQDIRPSAQ